MTMKLINICHIEESLELDKFGSVGTMCDSSMHPGLEREISEDYPFSVELRPLLRTYD
jgi:hypothetical protein